MLKTSALPGNLQMIIQRTLTLFCDRHIYYKNTDKFCTNESLAIIIARKKNMVLIGIFFYLINPDYELYLLF